MGVVKQSLSPSPCLFFEWVLSSPYEYWNDADGPSLFILTQHKFPLLGTVSPVFDLPGARP
jgi:hypothetical protein